MVDNSKQVRISRQLAKKLLPLALTIWFIISIALPGLYCFLEYKSMKDKAQVYAKQLSWDIKMLVSTSPDLWKYQATKYSQIMDSFIPHKGISSIVILDENLIPITGYNYKDSGGNRLGLLEIKGDPIPIMFNNHRIGEILIGVAAQSLFFMAWVVFIICLLMGILLSLFIYRLPLKIVTRLESELMGYQQTLEEKARLEALNWQLQKADSLDRMAGAIAHHFNNQLGVVIGNLEVAIEDTPQYAGYLEYLTEAMHGARRAAEVSGLMLTYLGQTTGSHVLLELSEICRKGLPLLQAAAPKGLIIKADLPSSGPIIKGNANQIQQVLTNLITNAWEGSDQNKGDIYLTVKMVSVDIEEAHRFPIDWQPQDKDYVCLEVADAGCGIEEKEIDEIFDPFFTTKFIGRGLGLSVVLGIAKAHGGAVRVSSKIGRGSIFRVYLPVSREMIFRQPDKPVQAEIKGKGTVLIVEDEEMMLKMATTMLIRLGFNVLQANNGTEAVALFQKHSTEIRVVLCDLTMPVMDGWETMSALRGINPHIPVILSSGYEEVQATAGEHPELHQAFLHKPYQKAELKDALAKALGDVSLKKSP